MTEDVHLSIIYQYINMKYTNLLFLCLLLLLMIGYSLLHPQNNQIQIHQSA